MSSLLTRINKVITLRLLLHVIFFMWLIRFGYEFVLFIQQPIAQLIQFVPDDTFYYLKIAENAYHAGFISFDNINPTSGFHYLYFGLLYLVQFLNPTKEAFVLWTISLSTIAYTVGITILWKLFSQKQYYIAGIVLIIGLLLSDFERVVFMGLEVGLAFLAFTLLFYVFVHVLQAIEEHEYHKVPKLLPIILLALFCALSRSDLFIVLGICSVFYWLKSFRARAKPYLFAIGTAVAFAVHTGITYLLSSHFTQDSGAVKSTLRFLWNELGVTTWSLSIFSELHMVLLNMFSFVDALKLVKIPYYAVILILIAVLILGGYFLLRKTISNTHKTLTITLLLLFLILAGVYEWIFAQVQVWYFLTPGILFLLIIGLVADAIVKEYQNTMFLKLVTLGSIVMTLIFSWQHIFPRGPMYSWQKDMYYKAFELKTMYQNKAISGRIGIWNAGIIGYFSDLPIINLDGLVNTNIRNVITKKQTGLMVSELKRQEITFLADWDGVFHQSLTLFLFGQDFIDHQLVRIDKVNPSVPFAVYKIKE